MTFVSIGCLASVVAAEGAPVVPSRLGGAPLQTAFSPLCGNPGPEEVYPIQVAKLPGDVLRMTWLYQSGYDTDIVRGSVTALSVTNGDFAIATEGCVMNDSEPELFDDPAVPSVGEGYWYLLRADAHQPFAGCPQGQGTYNLRRFGIQSHQVGDRNTEIRASGRECSCSFFQSDPGQCTVWYP